jgi:hypothetical protein
VLLHSGRERIVRHRCKTGQYQCFLIFFPDPKKSEGRRGGGRDGGSGIRVGTEGGWDGGRRGTEGVDGGWLKGRYSLYSIQGRSRLTLLLRKSRYHSGS